jgi:hypothetical protein
MKFLREGEYVSRVRNLTIHEPGAGGGGGGGGWVVW